MKKLLVIAILMLALVFTVVACTEEKPGTDTTVGENTTVETPTEAPTDPSEETTEAPTDPSEETTEAPTDPSEETTEEVTTEEVTTEEVTTEEVTTEEVTTEEVTTEEVTTADPTQPVVMGDAAYIAEKATIGSNTPGSTMAVGEITTEYDRTFVRLTATGNDPYFMVFAPGANIQSDIVAISYRTNSAAKCEFYVGSGAGITAQGDHFKSDWTEGGWNLLVIDLSTVEGLTSITGDMVNFLRLDFFDNGTFAEGDYIDIEYVAFFQSVEAAKNYEYNLHGAPVVMGDVTYVAEKAVIGSNTQGSTMAVGEVTTEGDRTFVRLTTTGGDPYFMLFAPRANIQSDIIAISYRTNSKCNGEFYVGSGAGITAQGDHFVFDWIEGDWNLLVIDLSTVESLTSITGDMVNFLRLDFFTNAGEEGDYIDIEYVAFFNSPDAAKAYEYNLHGAPVAMGDAAYIAEKGATGNDMSAGEVTTEDDRTFVRLTATGGDPYFNILAPGANIQSDIIAISYRTNSTSGGQFFVGSGAGITAQGDNFVVDWTEGGWNLLVIDLSTVEGLTSITGDMVNFLRLDFFTGAGAEGDYFDIEYVAFFKSVSAAEAYYNNLHQPEIVDPDGAVKPVAMGDASYIAEKAAGGNQMAASEVTTEDDRTFVRLTATGGDPYFNILTPGANVQSDIIAISYRTNSVAKGQFYVGSGGGITAKGDNFFFEWTEGDWALLVIDLSTVEELTSITGDMVNFLRLDFFHNGTFAEGDYIDIEYVAFFDSVADAETYYNDLHQPEIVDPETPEA